MPGTIGVRGEVAGWNVDLSAGHGHDSSTIRSTTRSTRRSDRQARATSMPAACATRQNIVNLDVSHEYAVGFAKPLTVAAGARISPRAVQDPPGRPPVLGDRAAVPAQRSPTRRLPIAPRRAASSTRRPAIVQLSRAARRPPARRASPAFPASSADQRQAAQLCRLCRARHRSASRG